MKPSAEQLAGLNVALNEARLFALDLDLVLKVAVVELGVWTLPEQGPPPQEAWIELRVFPLGRLIASFVSSDSRIKRLSIEELPDVVRSFGGQPIYGWEFFDPPSSNLVTWSERLSLDFRAGQTGLTHTLHLFQDSGREKLDVCLWFDEVEVRDTSGRETPIDAVIANGKRWWDGVFSGDPRTSGSGIQPLKKNPKDAGSVGET